LESEAIDGETTFPSVSIIVATLNSESTIDECLRSILELDYPKDLLEVIVIDGGSEDSTVEHVKAHPVKLISKRLNVPSAYNFVLKTVKGEMIGFIDSDVRIERQWLKKLSSHLNSPNVAGASGNIATWNNTQYDTDLVTRITRAGYRVIFDSDVFCYHFHRPTLRKYFRQQFRYGQNTWKLYSKHPDLIRGDNITGWWMNIQPIVYAVGAISVTASAIANFNPVGLWIFLALAIITTLHYTFSAARISRAFRDLSAMFLVLIFFIRAVAWTLGGATSFLRSVLT